MAQKYIHFSIDDVFDTLWELGTEGFRDVFEQRTLKFLKELHDQYGCTFSGYCFFRKEAPAAGGGTAPAAAGKADGGTAQPAGSETLRDLSALTFPAHIRAQLRDNASWLKFGFHALDHETAYGPTRFSVRECRGTYEQAREDCRKTQEVLTALGGEEILDLVPRIHYFAGAQDALQAWKDLGIRGLLSADDDRLAYTLSEEGVRALKDAFYLEDRESGLFLIRTALRLEKTEDPAAAWQVLTEGGKPYVEIFTHEYYMDEPAIRQKFTDFARLAERDGLPFGFAQEAFPAAPFCRQTEE